MRDDVDLYRTLLGTLAPLDLAEGTTWTAARSFEEWFRKTRMT